jgi:hypothetical protein
MKRKWMTVVVSLVTVFAYASSAETEKTETYKKIGERA